jgi:hypothetical protein
MIEQYNYIVLPEETDRYNLRKVSAGKKYPIHIVKSEITTDGVVYTEIINDVCLPVLVKLSDFIITK